MPSTGLPIPADPSIFLWVFFLFGFVITAYFVFALLYHWLRFGHMYPLVWVALPVYLIGVFILVVGMLGGIALA